MYKQWNRLLAFLMTVAVVMTSLTYPVKADTTDPWDSVASTDWMAKIDGDLKITQINIPGTHDSGTKYVEASNYSQCQDKTIAEQLAAGIRFLDIRVEMDSDGNLRLVHGSTACKDSAGNKLYLDTVLSDCYAFLDAHPTEAIIMSIKKDNGDATDAKVQAAVHKYIDANAPVSYTHLDVYKRQPLDCIIFLIAFILLRQETGGYHAPGYKTCFLFSCIVLVLALLWVKLKVPFQTWITMGLMLLASGVIYVNAPLESENKVLGSEQKAKIKIQARQILAVEMIAGILLLFVDVRAAYAVCSAIIWCGLGCVLWLLQNWMRGKHIN